MSKEQPGFGAARFGRMPAPRPIARPALLARLDGAPGLTVVVAGRGAGKSTLLNTWAQGRGARLLEVGPLLAGHPELREAPLDGWLAAGAARAATTAPGSAGSRTVRAPDPVAHAVRALRGGGGRGAVVVDGVDELAVDAPVVQDLAAVCRTAPAGLRLMLVARAAPAFAVEDALWLGDAELAFAEDETYQVLAASLADAAAADALAPDLHLLTNGWPELVGLAAAWLGQQAPGVRGARLRALSRADGHSMREHLVGAVISGLKRDDRELVGRLAHLPGVDAALADRLDLTEDLVALPPLVQAMPGRAGWFAVPNGLKEVVRRDLPMSAEAHAALLREYQAGM